MTERPSTSHRIAGAMTLGLASGSSRDYTPAVYGALLVTTLIAVQWSAVESATWVAALLIVSVVVFWLTHVWSGVINLRVRGTLTRADLQRVAMHEAPMLAAVVIPAVVLAGGDLIGMDVERTVDVAMAISVGQLFVWGLAVGRSVHLGWLPAVRIAVVDCLLGLVIVALKVLVLH